MKYIIIFLLLVLFAVNIMAFELFAEPLTDKSKEARTINTMHVYKNKLFLGYGDYGINTGPTDVICYNFSTNEWENQYTVQEEAIVRYREFEGNLYIPGVDATDNWDFGNYYRYDGNTWIKSRSIPHGIHVFDLALYDSVFFTATGNYIFIDSLNEIAPGAILSSNDGEQWLYDYISPSDKAAVYRITDLIVYNDELLAFYYAYSGLSLEDIPDEYRAYLGKPFVQDSIEYYLTMLPDVMGQSDMLAYNGDYWQPADIIHQKHINITEPFEFADKLILYTVEGEYVSGLSSYIRKNNALPGNVSTGLYMYDGEKTLKINLEFDLLVDACDNDGTLYMLIMREGKYSVLKTTDMEYWNVMNIPTYAGHMLSIAVYNNTVYLGNDKGSIYSAMSGF